MHPSMTGPAPATRPFARPVIVLSAPRSGSTLLFETLARSPSLHTIGGESHRAIESIPALRVAARGFDSNRLTADDARPAIVEQVLRNFAMLARDRDGRAPSRWPVRLLEKTPKNCLRVPFLRALFPDARFVVLARRPEATIASMIDAWTSGRFVTYPQLPGWQGPPWSLLLVPGWRELAGAALADIATAQWARTMDVLLDDLAMLPAEQVLRVRYEDLLAQPDSQIERLCAFAGIDWDQPLTSLPLSRYTLTPPSPDKWRRHAAALSASLPRVQATVDRVDGFFAA